MTVPEEVPEEAMTSEKDRKVYTGSLIGVCATGLCQ